MTSTGGKPLTLLTLIAMVAVLFAISESAAVTDETASTDLSLPSNAVRRDVGEVNVRNRVVDDWYIGSSAAFDIGSREEWTADFICPPNTSVKACTCHKVGCSWLDGVEIFNHFGGAACRCTVFSEFTGCRNQRLTANVLCN